MEDDISDDIYGDLGDFESNNKITEQTKEIASLTERLNQSAATIAELQIEIKSLKKEKRDLEKSSSSLYLTAKLELGRKQRDITSLQQKIDNRIFRRPNNCSKAVQTDVTTDPLTFHCNAKNNGEISLKQEEHQQVMTDVCTPASAETLNKCNNTRNDPSKFRIPKKNPFSRHENDNHEARSEVSLSSGNVMGHSHDQRRHNLPKKNPHARSLDGEEDRMKEEVHVARSERKEIDEEKSRIKDRRDETKDNRRNSPITHASRKNRDYPFNPIQKWSSNSDEHKRDSRRDDRKYVRGRSSSGEMDRHSKRRRSDSTSKPSRSRSRPSQNVEKRPKTKSPKRSHVKRSKDERIDDAKLKMDSLSDLKEKDLEAMLVAHKKILHEIDSGDSGQHPDVKGNSSKERRKRKTSNNVEDPAKKATDQVKSEYCKSANDTNVAVKDESKNTMEVLAIDSVAINPTKSIKIDVSPENVEVLPSAMSNQNLELPVIEVNGVSTNDTKQFVPFREYFSPTKRQPKLQSPKVETAEGLTNDLKHADDVCSTEVGVISQPNPNQNCPENQKELPTAVNDSNNSAGITNDTNQCAPLREFVSPTKEPSEQANVNEETKDPPKTNQFQNNENSNSEMDLDYELMQRTSGENQSNLSCEEKNRQSMMTDTANTINPIVNNDFVPDTSPTHINASFIAMENSVPEGDTTGENNLNSSHERHIQTKSSEYTVQDVGHEIRIFLTKKRKKNKSAKAIS